MTGIPGIPATRQSSGRPPGSKGKKDAMNYKSIWLKIDTIDKITKMAAKDGRTFSGMLRRVIERGIEREGHNENR